MWIKQVLVHNLKLKIIYKTFFVLNVFHLHDTLVLRQYYTRELVCLRILFTTRQLIWSSNTICCIVINYHYGYSSKQFLLIKSQIKQIFFKRSDNFNIPAYRSSIEIVSQVSQKYIIQRQTFYMISKSLQLSGNNGKTVYSARNVFRDLRLILIFAFKKEYTCIALFVHVHLASDWFWDRSN